MNKKAKGRDNNGASKIYSKFIKIDEHRTTQTKQIFEIRKGYYYA